MAVVMEAGGWAAVVVADLGAADWEEAALVAAAMEEEGSGAAAAAAAVVVADLGAASWHRKTRSRNRPRHFLRLLLRNYQKLGQIRSHRLRHRVFHFHRCSNCN